MFGRHSIGAVTCAACVCVAAQSAHADTPAPKPSTAQAAEDSTKAAEAPTPEELAAARELWMSGLELEKAKDWSGALDKLTKVGHVRMTPQVRYHIAFCSEHLGKYVDALNGYQLAIQEARALGDKARDVAENTPARLEAVRSRIAKLRLHVEGKLRASTLSLDGKKLSRALVDHDIPVDPGAHKVEVRRAGAVVDAKTVTLAEGATAEVSFTINEPIDLDEADGEAPVEVPLPPAPAPSGTSRLSAYVTGGAGLALVAGGGVVWALREATIANIRLTCTNGDGGCDPNVEPTEELGRAYTNVGRVLFAAGGAAVVTGVTLFFVLAPDETDATTGKPSVAKAAVGIAPTPGGAVLYGAF
jgi:hypothetical protein